MKVQNRIDWIDRAKGVGIVLVVLGHTAISIRPQIYLFHMPMFFMLAGFLFKAERAQDPMSFVLGRARRLLVPYVFFFLISVPVARLVSGLSLSSSDLFRVFLLPKVSDPNPNPTLWFFTALFWVNLIYAGILRVGRPTFVILLSALVTGLGCVCSESESLPLSFIRSLYFVLFFAIGHQLRVHRARLNSLAKPFVIDLLGIASCVALYCFLVKPSHTDSLLHMGWWRHFPGIFIAVVFSAAVVWICSRTSRAPVLDWLGRNSHIIFPLHIFTLEFFTYMLIAFGLSPKFSADTFCIAGSLFSILTLFPVVVFLSRNWLWATGRRVKSDTPRGDAKEV